MAKKSKKQQDDQHPEEEVVETPEDRLDQMREAISEEKEEEKTQAESSSARKQEQDRTSKEAKEKPTKKPQPSGDDLLADVRQALAAEEVEEEPKGFFGRLRARLSRSKESKSEQPEASIPEIEVEPETETDTDTDTDTQEDLQEVLDELVEKPKPKPKKKKSARDREEEKAVQEFFADLEALADLELEGAPPSPEGEETAPDDSEPEEKVAVPKLPVKSEAEDEVDFEAVRQLALEEYDETKVELEERKAPLREEVRQTIRELKPLERMLLIGFGLLTVLVLISSGVFLIANSISVPTPTPTPEFDPGEMVHPTKLTLPGGWEFTLRPGNVVEGVWEPAGPEWLVGTEISRWVALPWSLQLEAVLRTLNTEDDIELTMSSFDVLTYNVYSIQEITMEELLAMDQATPSLVVVLYNDEEADGTFWTVTALP